MHAFIILACAQTPSAYRTGYVKGRSVERDEHGFEPLEAYFSDSEKGAGGFLYIGSLL